VILGIAIFATAATPGGDLVSPTVLGLSMYVLFELAIVLIRRSGR
jgi:Sec-independent protein secretion pathway component TatC